MNYIQFDFAIENQDQLDQLIALLSKQNFEGFEEGEKSLKAFIAEDSFNNDEFNIVVELFPYLKYTRSTLKNINWNAQWENSFKPVRIGSFVAVRAKFHLPIINVVHEIIITPQMSFGTGHHDTTYLMLQQMQYINLKNKSVLDFGTGTGVLAILAEKLGATNITAIDMDEWSIQNARENVSNNHCFSIQIHQSDSVSNTGKFDIIVANINLNVIKNHLHSIAEISNPEATILLSGFLKSDEIMLLTAIQQHKLIHKKTVQKNEWICMICSKTITS